MSHSPFTLTKWYLDCVGDDGTTFLAYAALLRWKRLTLRYSSALVLDPAGRVQSRASLKEQPFPETDGSSLRWNSPALEVEGNWIARDAPVERQILSTPEGVVVWSCLQPRATTEIRHGTGAVIRGLGYAERLEMTLDPRLLPMDQLRWGRYLSDSDALVWIEWTGATSYTLVLLNGTERAGCTISKEAVILEGGAKHLHLDQHALLRDGTLMSTTLSMIPGIELIAPRKILQAQERKWRSHGRMTSGAREISTGWAIHEVVNFGGSDA